MPTAISLFSGAGGDSLGMKSAGVNVIAYNEINSKFCQTHQSNFPDCELIQENNTTDITKISDETFSKYTGKIDIIFAGFPCQGFSKAGKKRDDDPRNGMFIEFVRATRIIQPTMIIGENVKGLLKKQLPSGEKYIDIIQQEFVNMGYVVSSQICKCDEYNVPQKRERLIIIGIKPNNPYNWTVKFPPPNKNKPNLINIVKYNMENSIKVPDELFQNIPASCILTDMTDVTVYAHNNNAHPYLVRKTTPTFEQRTYVTKNKPTVYDNLFSFGKRDSPIHCEIVNVRNPCKTIICTYEHQPRLFVPLKNASGCFIRTLLPDELKQIQGFPLEYIITGNTKEKIIQIGNAVPPPLIQSIVHHIMN
jgi:DNA (cytosine-5)-methyltransferase 1